MGRQALGHTPRVPYAAPAMDLLEWLPLVQFVVQRLSATLPQHMRDAEWGDLLQLGYIGLHQAAQKFDPGKGVQFQTFAEWRVRGEILDYLRCQDQVGRSQRARVRWAESTRRDMEQQLGRAVGLCEVAEALGVDLTRIATRLPASSLDTMLHDSCGEEGQESELHLASALGTEGDQVSALEDKDLAAALAREIARLRPNEQLVLQLYIWEGLNMKEIGLTMGLTESRICQLYNKAIRKLQAPSIVERLRKVVQG